jgi:hypothetical protein
VWKAGLFVGWPAKTRFVPWPKLKKKTKNMKIKRKNLAFGICFAGVLTASSAQAGLTTLTFDENGNTTGLTGETYLSSFADSESGTVNGHSEPDGGASTLTYLAPLGGVFGGSSGAYPQLGWVAIYAPGGDYGTTTGLLDLIHFDNSYTGTGGSGGTLGTIYDKMFFYSTEGSGNLADHMPSSSVISTVLAYTYTTDITENSAGDAFYTPGGADYAGYSTGGTSPTQYEYEFESAVSPVPAPSPAVPETSTWVAGSLLLLPFGMSAFRSFRKNRTA